MRASLSTIFPAAALAGCLFVGACATPYQDMGLLGGVAAERISANIYRIVSRGNGYTSRTAITDYTLLKAAETTRHAGGTHFVVISAADASSTGYTAGSVHTQHVGSMAMSTYSPPQQYVRPGQDTYIRVVTVRAGTAPPQGAISADEIIEFIGRRIPREKV